LTGSYSLHVPDIARRVLASQARERQQKDEFCGPFWVVAAVAALTGQVVTQDDAAVAAGTLLTAGGGRLEDLPPGAASRADYLREVPTTQDTRLAGTSSPGIVRAISELSGGEVTAVPLCGQWTDSMLNALAGLVLSVGDAVAILNVATQYLWHSHPALPDVLGYLDGAEVRPAASEWQVGHYVAVVGSLTGSQRQLLMCADTYPSLGTQGVHLQPAACLAAALNRDGAETSGGAIVAVQTDRAPRIQAWAATQGLSVAFWDNGAPDTEPLAGAAEAGGTPS
jgi:hypothetical protein